MASASPKEPKRKHPWSHSKLHPTVGVYLVLPCGSFCHFAISRTIAVLRGSVPPAEEPFPHSSNLCLLSPKVQTLTKRPGDKALGSLKAVIWTSPKRHRMPRNKYPFSLHFSHLKDGHAKQAGKAEPFRIKNMPLGCMPKYALLFYSPFYGCLS